MSWLFRRQRRPIFRLRVNRGRRLPYAREWPSEIHEDQFQRLVEGVKDYAIFALDPDGYVVSWNAGAEQTKGYRAEEILGQHFSVFYPPKDQAAGKPAKELVSAVECGRFQEEGWRVRKDGSLFWASVTITPIFDPAQRLEGFSKVTRDLTAARAAALDLAALEYSRLRAAQRLGQLGTFTYDGASKQFTFSEQIFQIWGLTPDDDLSGRYLQLIHPEDRKRVTQRWIAAKSTGGAHDVQYRILRPDGTTRHLRVATEVTLDASGNVASMQGTHHDVTELAVAQNEAATANSLFEAILSASPDYTFVSDLATGQVRYGSPGKSILGIPTQSLEQRGPDIIGEHVHPDERIRMQEADVAAGDLADGQVFQLRFRARHVDGSWRWLYRRETPFRRDESTGRVVEVLGVIRDVTEVVDAEDQLAFSALHDSLTGLPNRGLLMDRLETALTRADQTQRDIAVLFCDLDGFKSVNDSAGHSVGDAVLTETARRLKNALREHDTIARVGGDEFIILIEPWKRPDSDVRDPLRSIQLPEDAGQDRALAVQLAVRISDALRPPISLDGQAYFVTASIGIAYAGPHAGRGSTPEEVLQNADTAMYRAKHAGKDRFEVFEGGLRSDPAERLYVEGVLREALHRLGSGAASASSSTVGELSADYQPIVDSGTGLVVGFEALARLTDSGGRSIPPSVFIKVAENSSLIGPLGRNMLDLACGQLSAWRREYSSLQTVTMSVNVSPLQALNGGLIDDVRDVLDAHGLHPHDLVLELSETDLLQSAKSVIEGLQTLRETGVGIAIDDFGTGYASLRYLARLPVSALKVDQSFTAGLPHDGTSCRIVAAVVGLANDLRLGCIVEGVETLSQLLALPPGVGIQGWLTGRSAPAKQLDMPSLVTLGAAAQMQPAPVTD